MLIEMIEDQQGKMDMFNEMIEMYQSSDLQELADYTKGYFEEPSIYKLMVDDPNERWIHKIAQLIAEESSF
ncbi:MAG: hypothetical protein ACI92W_002219 [Paraglaciecola sp.]|jgi:uncharacterized protein YbaP (TraB family)